MKTIKIVLTGGPGGGKSKAIRLLKEKFAVDGKENEFRFGEHRCLFMGETASELITGGVKPDGCNRVKEFQQLLFKVQLEKETAFDFACEHMPDDKYIIFYDRGLIDGGAYITDEEYNEILCENTITVEEIYNRYDVVFSFETPLEYYTTDNNIARSEDRETAKAVDERTVKLWSGHNCLHIIKPKGSYEEKFEEFFSLLKGCIK